MGMHAGARAERTRPTPEPMRVQRVWGAAVTAPAFSKAELRKIYASLIRLLPPGGRPLNAEELVEVNGLIDKARVMIAASLSAVERGRRVLSWRIPRELAPTMNELGHMKFWRKKKLKLELDDALRTLLPAFPAAPMNGSELRRWLRVTRFSTQRLDELSIDILGGKLPVDSLVRCGVLANDDEAHVRREPRWEKTPRGNTHVLVEVFEIAQEEVREAEPLDARVQQIVRTPGPMTMALMGTK